MIEKTCRHVVDQRPWGSYEILHRGANFQVKRIEVNPRARLSLQKHLKRSEKWTVVSGIGLATVNDKEIPVERGSLVEIPLGTVHRMANMGPEPLIFIEVQFGDYIEEDDIIRLADDYRRM